MPDNEILREFLLETHENLALLDSDLVTLEEKPSDKRTLAQVFRTLHSIKGTAGFIGLGKLQAVAHAAESLLSRLRDGEMTFNRPIATCLLKVVDAIRQIIGNVEKSSGEGDGDYAALIADLDELRRTGGLGQASPPAPSAQTIPVLASSEPPRQAREMPSQTIVEPPPFATTLVEMIAAKPPTAEKPQPTLESAPSEPIETRVASLAEGNIRVDVALLDKLMTLVGELVLSRNQIVQCSASLEDAGLLEAVQRLNLLTTELQASVMKTRMQPIGNLWSKFPRIVRDLAVACEKKVRFEMEGQETELDKTLIEAIRDPLTHVVRNAVDHGIERPEVRKTRGKPEEGRLKMHAFHEGGKVIIEFRDDGGGIDVNRVRDKAVQARLVDAQSASRMSRAELLQLIFLPGFSTADKVTQFSGRGVGMDVVRTNIERIGGTVDLDSVDGQGTTIRTKIPLTLAIVPALIVVCGGDRYAIPQVILLELVRLDPQRGQRGVEMIQGAPVYRLRGNLLPLVYLNEVLKLGAPNPPDQDVNIVVLQADDRHFGLVVDAIRDTEEIVVKPLQKQVKGIGVFAGATIMGDGQVALILDVLSVAQSASVIAGAKGKSIADSNASSESMATEENTFLLFSPTSGGQMAVPLSQVARLEEIPRSAVESAGNQNVVQYRGEILRLFDVAQELRRLEDGERRTAQLPPASSPVANPGGSASGGDSISVVVSTSEDVRAGLIVGRILDVVHSRIEARTKANRPGILFNAVLEGRVTEFVDLPSLIH